MYRDRNEREFHRDDESKEVWREVDRETRRGAWRIALAVLAVIVFVGLISAGIWALKVGTADVRGRGNLHRQITSAENRRFAQEHFQELLNQIEAYDRQLDQAAQDKAEHPGDAFFATNYSGLRKQCFDAVGQYNADANKISQARFRDADLPYQVDAGNPATDCKENIVPSAGASK